MLFFTLTIKYSDMCLTFTVYFVTILNCQYALNIPNHILLYHLNFIIFLMNILFLISFNLFFHAPCNIFLDPPKIKGRYKNIKKM